MHKSVQTVRPTTIVDANGFGVGALSLVARIIPKNYRNVTGRLASTKNARLVGFESTLEKDFLLLLECDSAVSRFEEQPITIHYRGDDGSARRYTPDVLVHFRPLAGEPPKPSLLGEIKYREELRQHWAEYRPKFKAAWRYARQQHWRFRLITEREVRTPRLDNARFLRRFRDALPSDDDQVLLLSALGQCVSSTPQALLQSCSDDRWRQAQLIPTLWWLVAQQQIGADLSRPLTMHSALWAVPEAL